MPRTYSHPHLDSHCFSRYAGVFEAKQMTSSIYGTINMSCRNGQPPALSSRPQALDVANEVVPRQVGPVRGGCS